MFSYNMIIQMNAALEEAGLRYKLHYLDEACAAFDPMGHCACEGKEEVFERFVKDALGKEGLEVRVDWTEYRIRIA